MPNSLELNVSPAQLHTFANHPFHVRKDMEMNELVDSIRESGVIVPLIVRSRPEGGYEIISAGSIAIAWGWSVSTRWPGRLRA